MPLQSSGLRNPAPDDALKGTAQNQAGDGALKGTAQNHRRTRGARAYTTDRTGGKRRERRKKERREKGEKEEKERKGKEEERRAETAGANF